MINKRSIKECTRVFLPTCVRTRIDAQKHVDAKVSSFLERPLSESLQSAEG